MNIETVENSYTHKIKYEGSKNTHYFKVKSGVSNKEYGVSVKVNCDCAFMGRQGVANGRICSHILRALREIVNNPEIIEV